MLDQKLVLQMKEFAENENVPIMNDDGIMYLVDFIGRFNVKKILEIGTAIGYSAIMMASCSPDIIVTTIERDEKRYLEAIKNIKKAKLEDRIHLIYSDAFDVRLEDKFDLIFIDAAKAQSINFFEMFEKNLTEKGAIITDNMNFHGLVNEDPENIKSRNLRQLVRKIKKYRDFLENNNDYDTEIIDIGDGLAVSMKK